MRIRHILPQPELGSLPLEPVDSPMTGVVRFAWDLAMQQSKEGHQVEIICPIEKGESQARSVLGIDIYWLSLWKRWRTRRLDMSYLAPLWLKYLRSMPVNVTHVHDNPFMGMRIRTKILVMQYESPPLISSIRYQQAVGRCEAVISCSDYIKQLIIKAASYPAEQIHVIPNGVDWAYFASPQRELARAELQVPDHTVVLVFSGRVVPDKGLIVLVEALKILVQNSRQEILLLVAGSAGLGQPYRDQIELNRTLPVSFQYEKQVKERSEGLPVRFLGALSRSELRRLYHAGDIFVCPSVFQEPFGIVNIEAASAGLPVIASQVGGIPEVIYPGMNGLLVPPENPPALAATLQQVIQNPQLRLDLARNATELARQYDWSEISARIMQVYQSHIQRGNNG